MILHYGWRKFWNFELESDFGKEIVSNNFHTHSGTYWFIYFKFTVLKWLKLHSNCPPWLEKIFTFTALKWLKWLKLHSLRKFWKWMEQRIQRHSTNFPKIQWHFKDFKDHSSPWQEGFIFKVFPGPVILSWFKGMTTKQLTLPPTLKNKPQELNNGPTKQPDRIRRI